MNFVYFCQKTLIVNIDNQNGKHKTAMRNNFSNIEILSQAIGFAYELISCLNKHNKIFKFHEFLQKTNKATFSRQNHKIHRSPKR